MDGRSLSAQATAAPPRSEVESPTRLATPGDTPYTEREEEIVTERLRNLGYI
jgi:hypothetical protein